MYKFIVCLFTMLLNVTHADSWSKPLGSIGECIHLYRCPSLFSVYNQFPLPSPVSDFLWKSVCGFNANVPQVRCGPLPSNLIIPNPADPVDKSDSYPESREKCGKNIGGNRIINVGYSKTSLDEFAWMTLLLYRNASSGLMTYGCAGSLINRRYVLTAAHCLVGNIVETHGMLTSVRLGEYDTEKDIDCEDDDCAPPPQDIPVQAFYPHFGYSYFNENRANDIGLVRLSQRASYTDFVAPICLASKENSKYLAGTVGFAAGWGQTLQAWRSAVKLKVVLPIFNHTKCVLQYFKNLSVQLTEKQLCAGGELKKDSCHGDSGSPFMRLLPGDIWEAIGITSFGYKCGNFGWPAVYTSVVSYLDWIQSTMIETNV